MAWASQVREGRGGTLELKIFVSHSSRDVGYGALVREHVKRLLPEDELLVDTDKLLPGEDWCAVLYEWLARCDAAVILFNREALKSPWVRREANVLLWRWAANPSFTVIPALLGDLRSADLKDSGFGDVTRLQMAKIAETTETVADAEKLASQIAARLASRPRPGTDPMVRWVSRVTESLRKADPQLNHYLTDAARELGIADCDMPLTWDEYESHRLLAAQMLGEGLRGGRLFKAARAVADAFQIRDPFQAFLYEVLPSWVDGQAARLLLSPPAGSADQRVLILNAAKHEIAGQYVDRANFNAAPGYGEIAATCRSIGEGGAEEVLELLDRAIRERLGAEDYPPDDHDLRPLDDMPYYLLVEVGGLPLEVVGQAVHRIHNWYPWLVVVLLTGLSLPSQADLRSAGLDQAVVLAPALAKGDESTAYQLRRALANLTVKWDPLWRAAS
jgi:TIR domain